MNIGLVLGISENHVNYNRYRLDNTPQVKKWSIQWGFPVVFSCLKFVFFHWNTNQISIEWLRLRGECGIFMFADTDRQPAPACQSATLLVVVSASKYKTDCTDDRFPKNFTIKIQWEKLIELIIFFPGLYYFIKIFNNFHGSLRSPIPTQYSQVLLYTHTLTDCTPVHWQTVKM